MEIKSHKKMYKAGKQWAAVAVATTAAGVAFVGSNESASADVWQANTVDQVASQVSNNGGVSNYQIQQGDTVWALAMATNDTVDNFAAVNGIVNPDLIIAGQHFNGASAAPVATTAPVNQQPVQPTQTAYTAAPSADEVAAANEAVAASQAAESQAAASQAAASEAYAASVAASQAAAASMAAAESGATAASEAAAKAAESQAIAETAKANAAAQSAQSASVANNAAASAAASQSAATAQQSQASQTSATAATSGNVDNSTFNALKSKRSGMTTEWSSDLAAQAQARAQQIANAGGAIPSEHWSNPNEVISIGFGSGSPVVDAWYNETNMTTASGTGHRDWEMRAGSTHFGFAQVGNVIVGVSK